MTDRPLLTVALLVLPLASAAAGEEIIWLSSLDLSKTVQEWGKPGINRAVTGKPLSIAGQEFERGLGTHAQSRLRLKLTGDVRRFEAYVGLDDGVAKPGQRIWWGGNVHFRVVGDGRNLWETKAKFGDKARHVRPSLEGVKHVDLVVEGAFNGISGDHADWADAKFVVDGGTVETVEPVQMVSIMIEPENRHQTFVGFGEGNMGQRYGKVFQTYPQAVREKYLDLLYTDKGNGLSLEICRANVTVGDDPSHEHMGRWPWASKNPKGWEVEDGKFDLTGHDAELWVYTGAAKRGATMVFFWNGPPYWMTVNGCASGSTDGKSNNLIKGQEPRYAKHIADTLELFKKHWALRADYVCPVNEPEADWWIGGNRGGQESCGVSLEQAIIIFRELARELRSRGMNTGLIGPEAAYGNGWGYAKRLMENPDSRDAIDVLSVHQYITSPWGYLGWRNLARKHKKPLWMSEWGNWHFPKNANSVRRQHHAVSYGRQIHDALTRSDVHAWCMWEPGNLFDFDDQGFKPRMAFHVMGHYSRFIRRGMVRIDVHDETLRTVAFVEPKSKRFVLVTLNDTLIDRQVHFDLTRLAPTRIEAAIASTFAERMQPLPIEQRDGKISCSLPRFSVLTLTGSYAEPSPK